VANAATATLLLPARTLLAGLPLPRGLGTALGRADALRGEAGARAQLQRHFAVLPRGWPVAALTRAVDAADAAGARWLRADPAWIRPDINGARLFAAGEGLRLAREDADALLPALQPLFGDAGMPIDAPHPSRWYLRLAPGTPLPAFAEPDEALGADLGDTLVDGGLDGAGRTACADARRWRTLLTEAQVVLHNHPWNARRAEAGKPPVNSLWFWGGGAPPDRVDAHASVVHGGDALLQGLAAKAGAAVAPLPAAFAPAPGEALYDLRDARDGAELLRRWLEPLAGALRAGALGSARLDFADGTGFSLARGQRWRLWRRPLPRLDAARA